MLLKNNVERGGSGSLTAARAASALVTAMLIAAALLVPPTAHAQTVLSIHLTRTLLVETDAETPWPIQVGPVEALPRQSYLRIRGLPPGALLSEGHSIGSGTWAVPLTALPRLKLKAPIVDAGRYEVRVVLHAIDGSQLAESAMWLVLAQPIAPAPPPAGGTRIMALTAPQAPAAEPRVAASAHAVAPAPTAAPKLSSEQERTLQRHMQKGDQTLAEGDIAAARLLYQRAADQGLAAAAMALAATYDPSELARLGVRGLSADPATAKRWYERARELGAADAEARLRRLAGAR